MVSGGGGGVSIASSLACWSCLSVATVLLPDTLVIAVFMLDLEIANEITRLLLQ